MIDSILPMASKQKHGTNDKLVDTLFLLDVSLIIWAFISDLFGWNASHIYLRPKKLSNPVKSGLRVSHSIIPNSSLSTPCSPPSPGPPFLCHSHVSRFGLRCGHHSTSRCRPTLRVPARPLLCLPPNGALTPNAGDPHAAVPHIAHGWCGALSPGRASSLTIASSALATPASTALAVTASGVAMPAWLRRPQGWLRCPLDWTRQLAQVIFSVMVTLPGDQNLEHAVRAWCCCYL
jgi:hypothetical protein